MQRSPPPSRHQTKVNPKDPQTVKEPTKLSAEDLKAKQDQERKEFEEDLLKKQGAKPKIPRDDVKSQKEQSKKTSEEDHQRKLRSQAKAEEDRKNTEAQKAKALADVTQYMKSQKELGTKPKTNPVSVPQITIESEREKYIISTTSGDANLELVSDDRFKNLMINLKGCHTKLIKHYNNQNFLIGATPDSYYKFIQRCENLIKKAGIFDRFIKAFNVVPSFDFEPLEIKADCEKVRDTVIEIITQHEQEMLPTFQQLMDTQPEVPDLDDFSSLPSEPVVREPPPAELLHLETPLTGARSHVPDRPTTLVNPKPKSTEKMDMGNKQDSISLPPPIPDDIGVLTDLIGEPIGVFLEDVLKENELREKRIEIKMNSMMMDFSNVVQTQRQAHKEKTDRLEKQIVEKIEGRDYIILSNMEKLKQNQDQKLEKMSEKISKLQEEKLEMLAKKQDEKLESLADRFDALSQSQREVESSIKKIFSEQNDIVEKVMDRFESFTLLITSNFDQLRTKFKDFETNVQQKVQECQEKITVPIPDTSVPPPTSPGQTWPETTPERQPPGVLPEMKGESNLNKMEKDFYQNILNQSVKHQGRTDELKNGPHRSEETCVTEDYINSTDEPSKEVSINVQTFIAGTVPPHQSRPPENCISVDISAPPKLETQQGPGHPWPALNIDSRNFQSSSRAEGLKPHCISRNEYPYIEIKPRAKPASVTHFSGDITQWSYFKTAMKLNISQEEFVSETFKAVRLKEHLKDKALEDVLHLCECLDENTYTEMWKILEVNYGGYDKIVNLKTELIMKHPKLRKMDLEEIRGLKNKLSSYMLILKDNSEATKSNFITLNRLKCLIPDSYVMEYRDYQFSNKLPDNIFTFAQWLDIIFKFALHMQDVRHSVRCFETPHQTSTTMKQEVVTTFNESDSDQFYTASEDEPNEVKNVSLSEVQILGRSVGRLWNGYEKSIKVMMRVAAMTKRTKQSITDLREKAKKYLLRLSQGESFPEELKLLSHSSSAKLPKRSSLFKLNPFLDSDGILRNVSGKNIHEFVDFEQANPIIIKAKCPISRSIIENAHVKYQHTVSLNSMLIMLYRKYHIIGLTSTIKDIMKKCLICRKRAAKKVPTLMGPLKKNITEQRPFAETGIDFAGPFSIKVGKGKVRKQRFVLVLTCMTTRCVHFEICEDQKTSSVLSALIRFSCLRGSPSIIKSDNQTSFIAARKELMNLITTKDQDGTQDGLRKLGEQTEWIFIPPRAPHFGGAWEIMVKAMKRALGMLTDNKDVTEDQFRTAISEAAALLNNRPLTRMLLKEKEVILTPNSFLVGNYSTNFVTEDDEAKYTKLGAKYQEVLRIEKKVWEHFINGILPEISTRTKWYKVCPELKVGNVVLVIEDGTPRGEWKMAVVEEVKRSEDKIVRSAKVRMNGKLFYRSIVNLFPLFDSTF